MAARPLLDLNPDADWTACYNRLLDLAPDSLAYLASRPAMTERAAPDSLRVVLHTSLLNLLANPLHKPKLSLAAYETTLDVLHFDPKVRGKPIGEIHIAAGPLPRAWHGLFPGRFDQEVAAHIDVEADRRAMLDWWREHGRDPASAATWLRLSPRAEYLWPVLSRRMADRWTYPVEQGTQLCAATTSAVPLLSARSCDYNLVRAVCIRLGRSGQPEIQETLIELVGHPSAVVSHNARFALRYSLDPRIRSLISDFERSRE